MNTWLNKVWAPQKGARKENLQKIPIPTNQCTKQAPANEGTYEYVITLPQSASPRLRMNLSDANRHNFISGIKKIRLAEARTAKIKLHESNYILEYYDIDWNTYNIAKQ